MNRHAPRLSSRAPRHTQAPQLTLHLHNGKFDEPDRLFISVRGAWQSALTSTADVGRAQLTS